jgi:hypothetical protein
MVRFYPFQHSISHYLSPYDPSVRNELLSKSHQLMISISSRLREYRDFEMCDRGSLQELMIASPLIPQFHHLLGPLFRDAGLPDGVLQILNFSEEDVAQRVEQLVAHEDIRVSISDSGM